MEKVVQILRKPARYIVIGALLGFFLFTVIGNIGVSADIGNALLILQVLLNAAVLGMLIAALLYAILKNKKEVLGVLVIALLGYAIVSEALKISNGSVAVGVFNLLAVLSICLTIVMELIGLFRPNHPKANLFRLLGLAGIGGYCLLSVGAFISYIVVYARNGAGWYDYFLIIASLICLPLAIAFGYLLVRSEASEAKPVEETKPEMEEEPVPEKEPEAESEPEPEPEPEPEKEAEKPEEESKPEAEEKAE